MARGAGESAAEIPLWVWEGFEKVFGDRFGECGSVLDGSGGGAV